LALVDQLGGKIAAPGHKLSADMWVYYNKLSGDQLSQNGFCPPGIKRVQFRFITESFFAMGLKET
jgi:hypothetical protein